MLPDLVIRRPGASRAAEAPAAAAPSRVATSEACRARGGYLGGSGDIYGGF